MKYDITYMEHNPNKKPTKQFGAGTWETYDKKQTKLDCKDVEEFLDKLFSLEKQFSMPTAVVGKYTVCADLGRIYVRPKR